jgi:PleD family two-component response regulator
MLDMDDFKACNDRHGHLAGDAVLRQTAAVLRTELRFQLDMAARYGGEEFAVILPNTPMTPTHDAQMEMDLAGKLAKARHGDEPPAPGHRDGAEEVAERIRRRIAATPFVGHDGKQLSHVTVSVGVAVFPRKTSSPEDLVANADAALCKAKRAGKNRVESYG